MSFQTQLTIPKEIIQNEYMQQPLPIPKSLKTSIQQKVVDLVKNLELTPHVSQELKKQLQSWKFQTLNTYFESLSTDAEKEAAAEVLTMLFFDVLRPAMLSIKTNEALDDLSIYKKQFKSAIKPLLPENIEVKTFLAQCDSADSKTSEFILQTTLINQHLGNIDSWFTENCEALNQKYYEHFEHIKQELSQFVNRWEDASDAVAEGVKILIKKLSTVHEHLMELDLLAIKIGDELLVENSKLDFMLAECSELLAKGVKK